MRKPPPSPTADDLQRVIDLVIRSGQKLARQGEHESIIAHAMIEAGVEVLTRIGNRKAIADSLRAMADAVECDTENRTKH